MTKSTDTDDKPTENGQASGPVTPPANIKPTTPPNPPADAPVSDEVVPTDPPTQPEPITEDDANKVVYRYVGPGVVSGIPDRDLTVLDAERLVPGQIRAMTVAAPGKQPLYEAV